MMDSWAIGVKAQLVQRVISSWDSKLPAYRENTIQLAKLQRMAHEFQKKFPRLLMFPLGQEGKIGKTEGEQKRRLNQQNKLADRLLRKLIEEKYISEYGDLPANKIRSGVKQFVEGLNRMVHQHLNDALLNAAHEQLKKAGIQGRLLPHKSRQGIRSERKYLAARERNLKWPSL